MIPLFLAAHSQTLIDDTYFTEINRRAERLARKLPGAGPVRIVAFGDSVTAGWGVDDPEHHTYHQLFAAVLRRRYPQCHIEMITEGGPGQTTREGLARLNHDVIRRGPDLVLVQFGGNDEGFGRTVAAYERDLRALLDGIVLERIAGLCIVCTPPMNDRAADSPFVVATRKAAASRGVLVADFDTALRAADRDYRGPFSRESHPGAFTHVILAKELLRTFDAMVGVEQAASVEMSGVERPVSCGEAVAVSGELHNVAADALPAELVMSAEPGLGARRQVDLLPGDEKLSLEFALGQVLPVLHPARIVKPILAFGRVGEHTSFDLKWANLAPAIIASPAGNLRRLPWHELDADSIVIGSPDWEGPQDLSARFRVTVAGTERLRIEVQVRDDNLQTRRLRSDPWQGDSVELYFDFRAPQQQGKPTYTPDVAEVILVAPTRAQQPIAWRPLDDFIMPLNNLRAEGSRTADGYQLSVELSLPAIQKVRGEDWSGMGFDVGVNDADLTDWRQTQMMFCGTENNYVDASGFAALYAPSAAPPDYRLTVR